MPRPQSQECVEVPAASSNFRTENAEKLASETRYARKLSRFAYNFSKWPNFRAFYSCIAQDPLRKLTQFDSINATVPPQTTAATNVVASTVRQKRGATGAPRHPVNASGCGAGRVPNGSTANSINHQTTKYPAISVGHPMLMRFGSRAAAPYKRTCPSPLPPAPARKRDGCPSGYSRAIRTSGSPPSGSPARRG